MEFNIIELGPSDYEDVLVGWWKDWDWQPPPKDFLPNNGVGGLMVTQRKAYLCWFYVHDQLKSFVGRLDYIRQKNRGHPVKARGS